GVTRIEKSYLYDTHVPFGSDPWLWDVLIPDSGPWPYSWWGPELGIFDLPDLDEGAGGDVSVSDQDMGATEHEHHFEARLNGVAIGALTITAKWSSGVITGSIPASALHRTGNDLSIDYFPS